MADTKISLLEQTVLLTGTEFLPLVQPIIDPKNNKKVTINDIMALAPVQSVNGLTGAVTVQAVGESWLLGNGGTLTGTNLIDGNGNDLTFNNFPTLTLAANGVVSLNAPSIEFVNGIATFEVSNTSYASINIPHGVAPTTPNDGDFWTTSAGGLFGRINGATINYGAAGGVSWLLASGGTATGTNTFAMGSNPFIMTSGVTTGTGATAGHQLVGNSLTTGNLFDVSSSSVSSGALGVFTSTSTLINHTAGTNGLVEILMSGANSTASKTAIGLYSKVTNTGTTNTNIAGYFEASGGTTNYALQVGAGDIVLSNAGTQGVSKIAGGLNIETTTNNSLSIKTNSASRLVILGTGLVTYSSGPSTGSVAWQTWTQTASTSGTPMLALYTAGAHTGLVASEAIDINYNLARTVQFTGSTGFATQRAYLIQAPTYAFASATGTITDVATLAVESPIQGTNATITNNYALLLGTSAAQNNTALYTAGGGGLSGHYFLNSSKLRIAGLLFRASTGEIQNWGGSGTGLLHTWYTNNVLRMTLTQTDLRTDAMNVFIANASGDTPTANTRLDVRGTGTTSNLAFRIGDSANTTRLTVTDAGTLTNFSITTSSSGITSNGMFVNTGGGYQWTNTNYLSSSTVTGFKSDNTVNVTAAAAIINMPFSVGGNLQVTSGSLSQINFNSGVTVNASGINNLRGFYHNPTLTGAVSGTHNAFESTLGNWVMGGSATNLTLGGGATASELRFLEPSGSGANYTAFKAVAQGADITYSLPPTVGAAGSFLTDVAGNGVLTWGTPSGSGDVVGPASSTDNAIARFDLTTGKLIQNSVATLDDNGDVILGTTGTRSITSGGTGLLLSTASAASAIRIASGGFSVELTAVGTIQTFANAGITFNDSASTKVISVSNNSGAAGNNLVLRASGVTGGSFNAGHVYLNSGTPSGAGLVGNIGLFTEAGSFGGGGGVLFVGNATTEASTAPTGGSLVWASNNIFKIQTLGIRSGTDSATSLTLDKTKTVWVFTGSSATTWTLPALAGNTDLTYFIKNRGSAAITLQRAGADNIYLTSSVTSITINPGDAYIITNDGAFWIVM